MTRGRPPQEPSIRNLEIYHELVCEDRLQSAVAARFRINQSRVAQIAHQVRNWIDRLLPATAKARLLLLSGFSLAAQSLHLAIALRRHRLSNASRDFLSHFGGVAGAIAYGQLLAAHDAGLLPHEFAGKLPPPDLIESAVRFAQELDGLSRLARRGPFANLPPTPSGAEAAAHAEYTTQDRSATSSFTASKTLG